MNIKIWQNELRDCVTNPYELFELLELDKNLLDEVLTSLPNFSLKVPRNFIDRMQKKNFHDPLLQQILPLKQELKKTPGYHLDPLDEKKFNPVPGLLHKYHGRVLLTLTSACGIHCRYCFRKNFPYEENNPGNSGWDAVFHYISKDKTISEVILSGGDPLVANDHTLQKIKLKLETIPHIKRFRIHSRMPIILPNRITPELIEAITSGHLKTILVTHCNHPQEINQAVKSAISLLSQHQITLLNQSVLLKKVNDDVETLVKLSESLYDAHILPYYLHLFDKIEGGAHFDLPLETARWLHWQMAQKLPGFLVPKLVCEKSGAPAKLPIKPLEFYTD